MQREIKFRAWDSVNHKIVTSGLAINLDTTGRVMPVSFSQGDLSYCRDNDVNKVPNVANEIQIMQYTGLKDRNGVEIYEGDVVKDVTTKTYLGSKKIIARKGQVKYGDYYAASDDPYCYADVTGFYIDGNVFSSNLKDYSEKELEVIGNIYEHSHLLKANQ